MRYLYTVIVALLSLFSIQSLAAQDCENDTIPPRPLLRFEVRMNINVVDAIVLYAEEFDKGSFDDCSDSLTFRMQVHGEEIKDSIIIDESYVGIHVVRVWVADTNGNWTYADAVLLIDYCEEYGYEPFQFEGLLELDVMIDADSGNVRVPAHSFFPDDLIDCGSFHDTLYVTKGIYFGSEMYDLPLTTSVTFDESEIGTQIVTVWGFNYTPYFSFQAYVNVYDVDGTGISCDVDTVAPLTYYGHIGYSTKIEGPLDSIVIPATSLSYFELDNCDEYEELQYRVIPHSEADGNVPTSENLVLTIADTGTFVFEYWVGDQSGNWTMKETYFIVDQNRDLTTYEIKGKAFFDIDNNCSFDNEDDLIPGLAVEAKFYKNGDLLNDTTEFLANTSLWGEYEFKLSFLNDSLVGVNGIPFFVGDTSGLEVQLSIPVSINTGCPSSITELINGPTAPYLYDKDFAISLISDCPSMYVDINSPFIRPCEFLSSYYIYAANYGAETAEDAYVVVDIDSLFIVEGSTIPWSTVEENTYTFLLGDMLPGEDTTFVVYGAPSCDIVMGQTLCTNAHIYPDSLCGMAPYTGPAIEVEGWCDETSEEVNFLIKNTGQSDMSELSEYIVVEDVIMVEQNSFDLPAGQDMMLSYPANGSTYRLEANQVEEYPVLSMPSVAIEGCGTNENGTFSLGFVTQFPQDELAPFIAIDCQENISSFDPNDKQGLPRGVGEDHLILADGQLDYRIRFQNTGTDTAFTVVILDTLSEYLDLETVRPGASSHSYEFHVLEDRVLEFRFDNIMLPDSNVNQLASNGFVQFSVMQSPNNPNGTIIENSAAIYFDYNEPVITNTTYHQIGDFEVVIDGVTEEIDIRSSALKVYPNPFTDQTTFELDQAKAGIFRLYRVDGVQILQQKFEGSYFELHVNQIAGTGLYFFEILTEEGDFYSGKLISQ